MRDIESLGEMSRLVHERLDTTSPGEIAAFWSEVPKFLHHHRGRGRGEGGGGRKNNNNANNDNHRRRNNTNNAPSLAFQLEGILVRTLERIETFSPRYLSQTTLAFAKIAKNTKEGNHRNNANDVPEDGSPRRILHRLLIGDDFNSKRFLFRELAAASMRIRRQFSPRHLSNLVYAFGLADECAIECEDGMVSFFDELALAAVPNMRDFNHRDLSNMLWAYGKKRNNNENNNNNNASSSKSKSNNNTHLLFERAAKTIIDSDMLDDFNPQGLSNLVWAYARATAKGSHPLLFEKVGDHIVERGSSDNDDDDDDNFLREFNPQELSNLVWAYATADASHPRLLAKVSHHIVVSSSSSSRRRWQRRKNNNNNGMKYFKPQELSNLLWAYATAGGEPHPRRLFEMAADRIAVSLVVNDPDGGGGGFAHPQHLSNIAWSYATMARDESYPRLFERMAEAAIERKYQFRPQEMANFLWAHATTANGVGQIVDKRLFESMAPAVRAILHECNGQDLANISWAYAVAAAETPSLFDDDFIDTCLAREGAKEFRQRELAQLHQWNLWQDESKRNGIGLPPSLGEECRRAFVFARTRPSQLQRDVISQLTSLGLEPEEEVVLAHGGYYRLDATVEVNGNTIGIEVDGPSHFLGRKPTGSTILKHRQITNLVAGLRVVSVPYWEWDELGNDCGKKRQYLCSLLGME